MNDAGWSPTAAHARAVLGGVALAALAVVFARPDLLILATPLLVAMVAGAQSRPTRSPAVRERLGHRSLTEGEATTYSIHTHDSGAGANSAPQIETIAAVLQPQAQIELRPAEGQVAARVRSDDGAHTLQVLLRPTRWGNYTIAEPLVVASSTWGAYRWIAPTRGAVQHVQVLPQSSVAGSAAGSSTAAPGLVGAHRSPRYGTGVEFATIRPFAPGDRLNRIRWPHSLRTGELQVASTWADQDRHVVLIVDAIAEVGRSTGVGGLASSLDVSVRAAAELAEHHISQGDRVSLVTVGSQRRDRLPAGTGDRHLRRIVATLASIEPAGVLVGPDRIPKNLGRGALVIILSPMRTPWALSRAVSMSGQGFLPIVVDCLPPEMEKRSGLDPHEAAAWRIERLRREHEAQSAGERGVAVVPWQSAGGLETVIRQTRQRRHTRAGWSR